jgi:hypothetical protein
MKFSCFSLSILIIILSQSCKSQYIVGQSVKFDQASELIIYLDENSDHLVQWAAKEMTSGMGQILDREVQLKYVNTFTSSSNGIYIGNPHSAWVKNIPASIPGEIEGKWEHFSIQKHKGQLLILGSDVRATAYGIFELAERMGVSPWIWWADSKPERKEEITFDIPKEGVVQGPSVQFRGIFLNDEDWGLQPWAAHTFEPEVEDIGPKTYEKIFQLLIRLKANTIWPAMHPCTKAFFSIPGNKEMAEKYHIYIGTSHAEPMLRNNVDEWNEEEDGDYNYFTNSSKVKDYWQERIAETKDVNSIITLGMRGIHDSGMKGNRSQEEKVQMLETIIQDQRVILSEKMEKPLQSIPQVFIPYKEVLSLYNEGLKIPEDVSLIWTDDNYGYIRRLSDETEQKRMGGSGIYYHLSYWGRPHDYLWLSTTQPGLIWYEMSRAYQNGAQKIWIANVGDIKPAEYNMEFFLDLAWDVHSIQEKSIKDHLIDWCEREFGENVGKEIAGVKEEYYRLAFLRKPEYMGWSQTEPTTQTGPTEFSLANANEIQRRIDAYKELVEKIEQIKSKISEEKQGAFFQMVEYPVKGAALMNQKFLYYQQSRMANSKEEKDKLVKSSQMSFDQIKALTESYNKEIASGKWDKMMSMKARNLPVFHMPTYSLKDSVFVDAESTPEPIFLQASGFSSAKGKEGFEWRAVKGLGYSSTSMTLFPLNHYSFQGEFPALIYKFDIEKPGKYEVEIRALPNHSNNFNHQIQLQVNGNLMEAVNINTKGRSKIWKENVLRNYAAARFLVEFEEKGEQIISVHVNQTGIVLDQISITAEGYPDYYEVRKE